MARQAVAAIRLAGAAAAIAAIAIAQQRQPFFATVTGQDGKPVAEAAVTCVFTPDAVNPWPRDVVVATSDARGRAKCNLQVGRLYTARSTEPLVLRLEPLPTMRLCVLDADGKPVEGARAEGMESDGGGNAGEPLQRFWQQLGFQFWWPYVRLSRSDAQGVMNVPAFMQGQAQRFEVRAACGNARVTLKAGGSEDVVLRQ